MAKNLVHVLLLTILVCWQGSALAQVRFHTSTPIVDSFPIVKVDVSVSVLGKPAPFDKSHLSIQEDGQKIADYELINCREANTASVAVVVDVSESMVFTLYTGDDEYYQSYRDFTKWFGPGSELAIVPFNDTVARIIPPHYYPGKDFFDTGNPDDVQEFIDSVGGLLFLGRTDVDFAIQNAVQHLKKAKNEQRSIVLVTDDAIYDYTAVTALLRKEGITLFVMEMDGDTIKGNIEAANGSGGKFFTAKDSNDYTPIMTQIADLIFAKHCQVRYVSKHTCPWWSKKTLWLGINYQNSSLAHTHYFDLGFNRHDSTAPLLTETKISEPARRIKAEEIFPCQRGIKTFEDSALVNFAKISRVRQWPDMAYDSIVVIDQSQPANGYYIAIDSSGNRTKIRIDFEPAADILPPVWSLPFRTTADQFQLVATELRKYDKGLKSIALEPGAVNLRIDSVIYTSHRIAQAYVSRIDPLIEASGCIIATDSVGNDSSACVVFNVGVKDFDPPMITQRPNTSPYVAISSDVTELKPDDEGIESVSITPITNIDVSNVTFTSVFEAFTSSTIIDTLYIAEALVVATDSAGNSSQLKLVYAPQPDTRAPLGVESVDGVTSRSVTITEEQPWDRGLRSVTVVTSTNVTPVQTTETRRLNTWTVSSIDPLAIGQLTLEAIDSAGNSTRVDVQIPAQTKPELLPLSYTDPLDFGTVAAPSYMKLGVVVTNPNDEPITLTDGSWLKDDSVFNLVEDLPITIGANGTTTLNFEYEPQLLGEWTAIYTFETANNGKYPILMTGRSTGTVHVALSNASVALSGEKGTLKVTFSGTPITTNADTISFSLELDRDVATLEAPSSDCAASNWLCNYDIGWADDGDRYSFTLARKSSAQSLVFSQSPTIEIPFNTYFAAEPTTAVNVTNMYASRSVVTAIAGSITVGEACGEPMIRSVLRGESIGRFSQISHENGELKIEFESLLPTVARLQLTDITGIIQRERSIELATGMNTIKLATDDLASGHYHVVVRTESSSESRAFTIVR